MTSILKADYSKTEYVSGSSSSKLLLSLASWDIVWQSF